MSTDGSQHVVTVVPGQVKQPVHGELEKQVTHSSRKCVCVTAGAIILVVVSATIVALAVHYGKTREHKTDATALKGVISHIGCHKLQTVDGPYMEAGINKTLVDRVAHARARAVEWLRQQQNQTTGLWIDEYTTAQVLTILEITGYVNDQGACSRTVITGKAALESRIQSSQLYFDNIPAGRLAEVIIGLRAMCTNARSYRDHDLLSVLSHKLGSYPMDGFDNLYQYSTVVIASYVSSGGYLTSSKGKVLESTRAGRDGNMRRMMSDTQAKGEVALEAIAREASASHQKMDSNIDQLRSFIGNFTSRPNTTKGELVNLAENMMAYIARKGVREADRSILECVLNFVIGKQDTSGSFADFGTTLSVLPLLAGKTLLSVREISCGSERDVIDPVALKSYIDDRRNASQAHETGNNNAAMISVRLQLLFSKQDSVGLVPPDPMDLTVRPGSTALQALRKAGRKDRCYEPITTDTKWGTSINSICDVASSSNSKTYWAFEVNGKMATVGAGAYAVNNLDQLTFSLKNY